MKELVGLGVDRVEHQYDGSQADHRLSDLAPWCAVG